MLEIPASHMMNHHMVQAAIMWAASIFSVCIRMYFLFWHIVPFLFLPHIVFSALAHIEFLGRLGPNIIAFRIEGWPDMAPNKAEAPDGRWPVKAKESPTPKSRNIEDYHANQ